MFAPLVRWALSTTDVPADLKAVARLQHVAAAGVVRTAKETSGGNACFETGGELGLAATLLYTNHDDYLLAGRTGIGALPVAWGLRGRTLDQVLVDTVVANEVAGRIGLAFAHEHRPDQVDLRVAAVAALVIRARANGLSESETTQLLSRALGQSGVPIGSAVTSAGAREVGKQILHPVGGNEGSPNERALGALGSQWLTRTLVLKPWPGTPWGNVALDGLHTILERHIKASEKRLRPDQLDHVDFRAASGCVQSERAAESLAERAAVAWSVRKASALLVGLHEFNALHLENGAAAEKEPDILALEPRIGVLHDWKLSTRQAVHAAETLGSVIGAAGTRSFLRSGRRFTPGFPPPAEWIAVAGAQPWRVAAGLRQPGGIESLRLDESVHSFPVEVKLYTTRGGWWPERRSQPVGGGASMEGVALRKHGNPAAAAAALAANESAPFGSWIEDLFA